MVAPNAEPTLPRLPSTPQYSTVPHTTNVPGQIPPELYDPAQFNRPLKGRRSRLAVVVRAMIVLAVLGGVAAAIYGVTSTVEGRKFPTVNASPGYRSSTFQETSREPGNDLSQNYVATIRGDAVDRVVSVVYDKAGLPAWSGNDTHWFGVDDAGVWNRIPNNADDSASHVYLMQIVDGLTIDEVIPPGARRFTDIIDVDRESMLGDEVRKFTTQVDVVRMAREDPRATAQFEVFWGIGATSADDTDPATAGLPVNVTVWVTDDGIVHQVESTSDFEDALYRITMVGFSAGDEYSPELPTDFVSAE
jgi:hypothetical protein